MAVSTLVGPDGKTYKVQHPEGASKSDIIRFAVQSSGTNPKPKLTQRKPGAVENIARSIPAGSATASYDVLGAIGTMALEGLGRYAKAGSDPEYAEKIDQAIRGAQKTVSEYTFDIGATANKSFGVDEGRFSADVGGGLGQLPLMVVTGGLASVPMSFAEVIKDAEQSLDVKYSDMTEDQKTKVAATGAAYAAFSLAADRIGLKYMGLTKLNKFFDGSETVKGSIVKEVLKGSLGEGLTETSQAVVKDQLARVYDDDREYNIDSVKGYLYEGAVAFTVGGIASTGTSVVKNIGSKTSETKKSDLNKEVEERAELTIPDSVTVTYKPIDGPVKTVSLAVDAGQDPMAAVERDLAGRYDPTYPIEINEVSSPVPVGLEQELDLPDQAPDPTQEQVPVQPEAAVPIPEQAPVEQVLPEVVPQVVPATEQAPEQELSNIQARAKQAGMSEEQFRNEFPDVVNQLEKRQQAPAQQQAPVLNTVQVDLQGLQPEELQNVVQQLRQKLVNAREAESKGKPVLGGSASIEADLNNVKSYIASSEVPAVEQAPEPATRTFSLPDPLKKGKPGYAQTQNITFASDLERATYSATTATQSDPAIRKRQQYRNLLKESGYSDTEINTMGREVRDQMKGQYKGKGSPIFVSLKQDVTAEASATYIPKRFVGDQAGKAPPFFQSFSPEQYDEGRFVDLETKQDLSNKTFKGGSIRIEGGRPILETSDNASETIINSKASKEGPLVRTNLFKQAAGWKWTKAPDGAPSTLVSVERGDHYYTLSFISNKPLTLKTYPDKENEPRGRPTTRGKLKLGKKVGEIRTTPSKWHPKGKLHPVYDTITVGEPDVVAEAAKPVAKPVSTSAAAEKIQLENLAPQVNEDFFQFWARVLDTTGSRIKASPKNFLRVAEQAVSDTLQFFNSNPKFATYYDTDKKLTRTYLEAVVGPVTDTEFNLYRILAGLTSPSTKLPDNIIDALRVFKLYKDNGNFNFIVPSRTEKGARTYDPVKTGFTFRSNTGATKATSILAIQKKIDEIGLDATIEYLLEPVTMTELISSKRSLGYKGVGKQSQVKQVVKQATGQDKLIPRMFMFGPKVGSYSMNTLGNVEYTTTDIWESRFIRSYFKGMLESGTGLPLNDTEQKIFQEFSSAFNEEFQKQTGQKLAPASLQAVRWFYILNAFQKTGYQYAKTDDTISGYTAKAAKKLYGVDPASGGQGTGTDSSQVPAGNRLFAQPLQDAAEISERYSRSTGLPVQEPRRITELDQDQAAVIGKAYDEMKHDPTNPEVRRAYKALVQETLAQYDAILDAGYSMELSNVEYDNSPDMIDDLRSRKVMRIFSTEEGFGSTGISAKARRENPMLADSGRTDKDGKPLLVNDVFRFVHDFFGHAKLGNGFGAIGEENAWNVHSLMFSPLAQRALASETRGQNAWVNFSGANDAAFEIRNKAREARKNGDTKEAKRLSNLAYSKMKFADQKIGLLPEEFSKSTYQEDVTAQATDTAVEDRGPRDTFESEAAVVEFIEQEFNPIAKKLNIGIGFEMGDTAYVAQYNVTQQKIQYNPMKLLQRTVAGVRAAMREEIIHAAMHNVMMAIAIKKSSMAEGTKVWKDFFEALGQSLTAEERSGIMNMYTGLEANNFIGQGSEYSRAVIQKLLYGEFTEQYVMVSEGGAAWNAIVQMVRSVQAYMAKLLGPMVKTNPEAAQIIVDTVELLKALDPALRPKSQDVVAQAYDATDKNTAKENTEAGERVGQNASERVRDERKWFESKIFQRKAFSKAMTPVVTRLRRINVAFARLFSQLEEDIRIRKLNYRKRSVSFFNKLNSIKGNDFSELKQLIFFSPTPAEADSHRSKLNMQRRDALLHKYGLLNMYRLDIQPILEEIYTEYDSSGMPSIGYLEAYFPRVVNDLDGLIKSYGHETKRTFELLVRNENIRRSEIKDKDGNPAGLPEMESSERARFFQDFLQNKFKSNLNKVTLPGNVKVREISLIPPDKLRFYDDPGIAFGKYTSNMVTALENYKIIGSTKKNATQGKLGQLTEDLFNAGQIDQADVDELKTLTELATVQFAQENPITRAVGVFTYAATLIDVGTVAVQVLDLYKVLMQRGPSATLKGVYRTVTGNREYDLERDWGFSRRSIMAEFDDQGFGDKALEFGLRYIVPFQQMDAAMKHSSIEATLIDFLRKAKSDVGSKKYNQLVNELTITLGQEDAMKAVTAFRLDKYKDSPEAKAALIEELLQRQPMTYLQVPETYRRNPGSRLFYKLKTFMLLDINFNRQMALNDLLGPDKTVKQRTQALKVLVSMALALAAIGVPKDMLMDWIRGKDTYLPDHVANAMLGIFGLNKYALNTVFESGPVDAIADRFTPAAYNILDNIENDLISWVNGNKEISEFQMWGNAPLFDVWGRFTEKFENQQKRIRGEKRKQGIAPDIRRF
jgi:hypothetical protein